MIFFPYKKVVIETEISQIEFLKRFKNITLEESFWSFLTETINHNKNHFFVGYVNKGLIKFRLLNRANDFYAYCKVIETDCSTEVELEFKISIWNQIISTIWFSILLSFSVIAILELGWVLCFSLLLPIIPFAYFWFHFKSGKIEKITNKILEISEGKLCKK